MTEIGEECLATGYYWVGSEEPVVDAKIYAPKGSYAIKYAKQNNIAYTETKAAASGNNSGNTSANITRKKVTVTAPVCTQCEIYQKQKESYRKKSGSDIKDHQKAEKEEQILRAHPCLQKSKRKDRLQQVECKEEREM